MQDSVQRLHARWLAGVMVALLPLGFAVAVVSSLDDDSPLWADPDVIATLGGLGFWLIPYGLCRMGHYRRAALLLTGVAMTAIIYTSVADREPTVLRYLVLPVLMGSVLLPTSAIYILIAASTAIMLLIPVFLPDITLRDIALTSLSYVLLGSGLVLLVARHRDTLEQHRTAELREREERYRALIEQSNDAIYLLQNGRFKYVNRRFEELFGYSAAEVTAPDFTPTEQMVAPESRELVRARREQAEQGISLNPRYEFVALHRDGRRIEVEASVSYVPYKGAVATQGILRDITERKQAEQRRIALGIERARAQMLADFILDASHEFRTPLAVINTHAHLLGKTQDAATRATSTTAIREQSAYLEKMVEAMFTLAELDIRPDFSFSPYSVPGLLRDLETRFRALAAEHNLSFACHLADDLPPVLADAGWLYEALSRLIENAIQYTPAGGAVTVSARQDREGIVVEVRDSGVGLSAEEQTRVFERFYRVDAARTTRGVGLGLPIAKTIIEAHQGCIEVESALGQGSVFRVWLPAAGETD